jgi:hypothetical protein
VVSDFKESRARRVSPAWQTPSRISSADLFSKVAGDGLEMQIDRHAMFCCDVGEQEVQRMVRRHGLVRRRSRKKLRRHFSKASDAEPQ